MFEGICEAITREMEMIDEKLATGKAQMSSQDLDHVDKMAHALKSLKAYEAMVGHSEDSYARGRSRTTGRYISRDYDSRDDYRRY